MGCQHFFIARHHAFSLIQRGLNNYISSFGIIDEFDHEIDVYIVEDIIRVGMTEQQAWATPVGVASWYEAASYEAEAGVRLDIVTDAERLAIIRAKSKQAAKEQNV